MEKDGRSMDAKGYETGQLFVKKIGAFGITAFMILFVGFLIVTFFFGSRTALDGYTPPQTHEYYAEHPEELAEEINEHVAPLLEGIAECHAEDGKVAVTVTDAGKYASVRTALLRAFDDPDSALFDIGY